MAKEHVVRKIKRMLSNFSEEEAQQIMEEIGAAEPLPADAAFLNSVGRLWSNAEYGHFVVKTPAVVAKLNEMDTVLSQPQSVLLVGEPGVGKTALVRLLARQVKQRGWHFFEARAVDVIAGQKYIGEIEGQVKSLLQNLATVNKIVWYIPNFHELLYAGVYKSHPQGVLDLILPAIERVQIIVIGETHPENYQKLLQERRVISAALSSFLLTPLGDQETLKMAGQWVEHHAHEWQSDIITEPVLNEAHQLAKHHLSGKGQPGNLMQLLDVTLKRVLSDKDQSLPMTVDQLIVSLCQLTRLPKAILDDRVTLDIDALRAKFESCVIGQQEAVECLIERVALFKAGLTDPSRPLGVFLFAGPTGTGKTEIAKTLAEFLFGSADRMIRLDMSEYKEHDSAWRLLMETETHSSNQSLVNRINRQPFSVVLLDEFEKAHANIWDLFLQVFDDGRLSDRLGNTADFRHSIIILTSNLGGTVQAGAGIGFTTHSEQTRFSIVHVEKSINETFRREFVNRLDRVVVFRPLNRNTMREILHKELNDVMQRKGLRNREWAMEWEESAVDFLLDKGFTQDLGARPLKRAIERFLLAPLALTIVQHDFPAGDQFLFIRAGDHELKVEFIDPDAGVAQAVGVPSLAGHGGPHGRLTQLVADPQGQLQQLALLQMEYQSMQLIIGDNDWVAEKSMALKQTYTASFWENPNRYRVLSRIENMDRMESALRSAGSLLERLIHLKEQRKDHLPLSVVQRLAQSLWLLRLAQDDFFNDSPQDVLLQVEAGMDGEPKTMRQWFEKITAMYMNWAKNRQMRWRVVNNQETPHTLSQTMHVSGFGVVTLLQPEQGKHIWEQPKSPKQFSRHPVTVRVLPLRYDKPIEGDSLYDTFASRLAGINSEPVIVRRYRQQPAPLVRNSIHPWRSGRLDKVLQGEFDVMSDD